MAKQLQFDSWLEVLCGSKLLNEESSMRVLYTKKSVLLVMGKKPLSQLQKSVLFAIAYIINTKYWLHSYMQMKNKKRKTFKGNSI